MARIISVVLGCAAFLWLFPFVWALIASFKPEDEVLSRVWALPSRLAWENYAGALEGLTYARSLANSLGVSTLVAVLQCATGTLAAYAFARMRFPGRGLLFTLFLATLMIPGSVTLTANFLTLSKFNWIDTYAALIIPDMAGGFAIFLLRQFFLTLPKELEEAARLDGAGHLRFLWHIALPLSKPALATVFAFVFIANYNEFLWPLIMTSSEELRTVQVALSTFDSQVGVNWGELMAAAVLTMLPSIVLFSFMQRAFIRGITRSGLK